MEKILDGKKVAQKINNHIKKRIAKNAGKKKHPPKLEIFSIGNNYASEKYTLMKKQLAKELGIVCNINKYEETSQEEKILEDIKRKNRDSKVNGIMIQMPLPKSFDVNKILNSITPEKDVDGLTNINLGKIFTKNPSAFLPATPLGIIKTLKEYNIDVKGKHIVICGRSLIVGIPLFATLLNSDATVTILHSKSQNIKDICSKADILISATGKPNYITTDFIKKGAIAIDVGIALDPKTQKLAGDINLKDVIQKVKYITPVPGGVGATTVPSLMSNVLKSWEKS